jgi:hypothetical protein
LGSSKFPIPAKRHCTLPALLLLGYQNPPLRQGLLSALIHAPSLPQSALADKMWFRYRSRLVVGLDDSDFIQKAIRSAVLGNVLRAVARERCGWGMARRA